MQLLNARLVGHRRKGIRRAIGRLGGIFTAGAAHLVHLLGLGVVGLHVLVVDGPGRRNAIVMLELAEVLLAQAVERRAIHLGGAAYEVMETGLEGLSRVVVPGFLGDVAVLDEHLFHVPILLFTFQPVAAFEYQDALARRRQVPSQRPAARAAANDDDVVFRVHKSLRNKP